MLKKKIALATLSSVAIVAPIGAVVSCNMSVGFKPSFYNYEAYMNQELIDRWNKDWNYKEFPDLPQFELLLKDQRTYGGVGSDYLNAKLAKQGVIQKIDFEKALHITDQNGNGIEDELQAAYTDASWELMKQFDQYIGDADKDGTADHLYEYMIPYFIQNKVVAFNFRRGNLINIPFDESTMVDASVLPFIQVQEDIDGDAVESDIHPENFLEAIEFANEEQYHAILEYMMEQATGKADQPFTYKNIFTMLQFYGFNNLIINDYFRDNMMIGSENEDGTEFTGQVTEQNYRSQIDGFANLISMYDEDHRTLETSGADTLSYLIDPATTTYDTALMYNGDALDAFYATDNFESEVGGDIRVIEPKNPTYLLDGVVVSSAISGSQLDKFYNSVYENIYQGAEVTQAEFDAFDASTGVSQTYEDFDALAEDDQAQVWETNDGDEEYSFMKSLAINYDFVNYTSPFRVMWNWLKDVNGYDYFAGDTIATGIADLPDTSNPVLSEVAGADEHHITYPVDDRLQNQMYLYYTSTLYK